MIHDAAIPAGVPAPTEVRERHGVAYTAARWSPVAIQGLAGHLATVGRRILEPLESDRWLEAWCETVAAFTDPESAPRRALDPALNRLLGTAQPTLQAGFEAVLGPVGASAAREALAGVEPPETSGGLLLVVLAGNLPGLAVQSLLPALARRRPVLVKSPSNEPLWTPAFVRHLRERCPPLAEAIAAVTWRGGEDALEAPVLERADTVIVYGSGDAVSGIRERTTARVLDYGPKLSLAVVSGGPIGAPAASGIARDVALFDQRGCLSIQAVFTDGDARALADALADALRHVGETLPPGSPSPREAVAAHQLRVDARMRGLYLADLDPGLGTVVVEARPDLRPSPGRRSVRVYPLARLEELPGRLRGWEGRLQGAALAGEAARELEPALLELGFTRCAEPGRLQAPDARWQNGGRDLFDVL